MDTNSVKNAIAESYGKLAKSLNNNFIPKLLPCCNPVKNAKKIGVNIGYSEEQLHSVPQTANLGIGCGNPSAFLEIKKGNIVVDLGSGAGFDAFIISPLVGEKGKVIGIDISDEMLKLAIKNAHKGNYNNVEFIKGDIENIPLKDETANFIISNCVINLSTNKREVFKEAYRVLKPDGKIAISDIILEKDLPDFIKHSLEAHIACVSGAEKIDTYLQYIKDAGFKNIIIEAKKDFPLELMLADPQIKKIVDQTKIDINSKTAKDIASRVKSISITAIK